MRQRVMIAMALSCDPELLIADEPTTALDVTIQAQILGELDELRRRTGTGIVFVTHDLGVVADIADRILVMYGGRIVEQGTVDELFYDPQHPYTWGLLGSIPRVDGDRRRGCRGSRARRRRCCARRRAATSRRAARTRSSAAPRSPTSHSGCPTARAISTAAGCRPTRSARCARSTGGSASWRRRH